MFHWEGKDSEPEDSDCWMRAKSQTRNVEEIRKIPIGSTVRNL